MFVQFGKTFGKNAVLSDRVAQTADGAQRTDQTGKHKRQKRYHKRNDAEIAEIMLRLIDEKKIDVEELFKMKESGLNMGSVDSSEADAVGGAE